MGAGPGEAVVVVALRWEQGHGPGAGRAFGRTTMTRALVVYESMWGNSELVAHAVAEGVAEVMPVDVTDVAR